MPYRGLKSGAVLFLLVVGTLAAKKKNPDDFTQSLALPRDPPQVAIGETRRLVFHVSPLTGRGLLAQQSRDALRALLKLNGGLPVIHLRAFVAGSGDVRRVPQIVAEIFAEKKMQMPSVSVVRAGGLPLDNAQVVFEAVSLARRDVNAPGLDFVVGPAVTAPDPVSPPRPLLARALEQLATRLNGEMVLAVSCFVSTMGDGAELSATVASRFPAAATNVVQTQRGPWQASAFCEAVARGTRVTALRLAFTGTRVAFGPEEKDAALAFQRLDRDLNEAAAPPANIVFTHFYPLSTAIAERASALRRAAAPVVILLVEGLASVDAGFAVDAVAAVTGP